MVHWIVIHTKRLILYKTRDQPGVALVITAVLQILMYPLKNILFLCKYWSFFCFECASRFRLQFQGEGKYKKKLDVKTFFFSDSNRLAQRYNCRNSRLSKLLLFVQKQLQQYNIRDVLYIEIKLSFKVSFTTRRNYFYKQVKSFIQKLYQLT